MCIPNEADEIRRLEMVGKIVDKTLDAVLGTKSVSKPKPKRLAVDYEIEMIYGKARGYIVVDVYGTIEGDDRKATRDEPATSRYIDGLYFKDVETGLEVPLPIGLIEYIEDEVLDNIGKCDGE